ncbi:MAG: HDOD domain-containing protein [Acidobacteria bacterium]|nr:HDOD domain-containing protein [Acidobacteriota bacterium]MBI3425676.1 HDOD domain-containing protein [Acidobacteriota bacterium]
MQKQILFVNDDPHFLAELKRMLDPMQATWFMHFTQSGVEALEILATQPFDVVVADMYLPGISGTELLKLVRDRYPRIVQILLSDCTDEDIITKTVRPSYQLLAKPCELERLTLAINRACAVRELLANEQLKMLISQMSSLPTLPTLYTELVKELQSPNSSMKKIAEIITRDMGMTAKILQMANSAFFGLRRHISNPIDAVNLLGLDAIVAMTLTIQVFSRAKTAAIQGFSPTAIWNHSLRVGVFAKRIAQGEQQTLEVVNDAFTAGLLHDAGKMVLATELPQQYDQMLKLARTEGLSGKAAERRVFGATHGEVGAYLLGLWGLPNAIIGAVAFHNEPSRALTQSFCPLTAVHVSNALDLEQQRTPQIVQPPALDLDYIINLGLENHVPVWTEMHKQATEAHAA